MSEVICSDSLTISTVLPVPTGCPFSPGQVTKVLFQLKYFDAATPQYNGIAVADADTLASYTGLLSAGDNSDLVVSPYVGSFTLEPGEEIELGGGNETPAGAPIGGGAQATKASCNMLRTDQEEVILEMKKLYSISGLAVYLVTHKDQVVGLKKSVDISGEGTPEEAFIPIPLLRPPFVGDWKGGELEAIEINQMMFYFPSEWSDYLYSYTVPGIQDIANAD